MTVTTAIQPHHLPPLCNPTRPGLERPLKTARGAFASNGQAALVVPSLAGEQEPLAGIDRVFGMKWASAGPVRLDTLRSFIRHRPLRESRTSTGITEPVSIRGVTVDARLLRRYLPGDRGSAELFRCVESWNGRDVPFPAMQLVAPSWELIIMALVAEPKGWLA